jgi:hypothetical protein
MNKSTLYKWLFYSLFALTIISSFIITSVILNLVSAGKTSANIIVIIIFNMLVNFSMFFFLYRNNILLTEKDHVISELESIINQKQQKEEVIEEKTETRDINIEELIDAILPKNVQSMDAPQFAEKILANAAKEIEIVQGLFFLKEDTSGEFKPIGKYAYYSNEEPKTFLENETLAGQVAKNKKILNLHTIPENYISIVSGLGTGSPRHLLIIPVVNKEETIGIIELAAFKPFDQNIERLFDKLSSVLGKMISTIK